MSALGLVLALAAQTALERPVTAALAVEPAAVEVGEPLEATLVVTHPSAVRVHVAEDALVPDESWVVLDARGPRTRPAPDAAGRTETRFTWLLASLEPGDRALPEVSVEYDWKDVPRRLVAAAATADVAGVLGDDETAPRPPRGFRSVDDPPAPPARTGALALLALLAAGLAVWVAYCVHRARPVAVAGSSEPPPAAVLAALAEPDPGDEAAGVRVHDEIARQLRRVGAELLADGFRSGWTGHEWVRALEASDADVVVEVERLEELSTLLDACDRARFGHERPTPFEVRDRIERARALCGALEVRA